MTLAIRDAESGPAGGLSKCSRKRLFAFSNEPNVEMSAVKEENESSQSFEEHDIDVNKPNKKKKRKMNPEQE
jgi:hypothetical protein